MARLLKQASFVILLAFSLTHCGVNSGASGGSRGTEVVNVSAYDPKEKQRSGRAYSPSDVSALRDNGAAGLIARAGKGGELDEKCATFLAASDRVGMLVGVYYRTTKDVSVRSQADQFVNRAQALAQSRNWNQQRLLLSADFDALATQQKRRYSRACRAPSVNYQFFEGTRKRQAFRLLPPPMPIG